MLFRSSGFRGLEDQRFRGSVLMPMLVDPFGPLAAICGDISGGANVVLRKWDHVEHPQGVELKKVQKLRMFRSSERSEV